MSAGAYYNEVDPFAAAWLRELIREGHIAPGEVDERDIRDVVPAELAGFTQCHFFAGIGVWSYALRRAGWPDDQPVWTGSCPCQPFSAAGEGKGFDDERHLWPAFFHLIEQCEPSIVAGEQVASGGAGLWFDLVQADLEAMGYAFGLVPVPAAGFGGAHIRDRAFWVADASGGGWARTRWGCTTEEWRTAQLCGIGRMGHAGGAGLARGAGRALGNECQAVERTGGLSGGMAYAHSQSERGICGSQGTPQICAESQIWQRNGQWHGNIHDRGRAAERRTDAPMLGRDAADWLFCRDGKWRPVEPGTFPLAHEAAARVGRLRGYGNAIDAEVATGFIEAVIDVLPPRRSPPPTMEGR